MITLKNDEVYSCSEYNYIGCLLCKYKRSRQCSYYIGGGDLCAVIAGMCILLLLVAMAVSILSLLIKI